MKHSKSGLLLMELIIAILFFALASTVCIRLFAKSHLLSKQTINQNHAVLQAQNLAEAYLATEGDFTQMGLLFDHFVYENTQDAFSLFFDTNWQPGTCKEYDYVAKLTKLDEQDGLIKAHISVSFKTDPSNIYELTICHHIPERRGNLD